MPTTRNELYRYTDLAPLLTSPVSAPPAPDAAALDSALAAAELPAACGTRVVIVDGRFDAERSNLSALPAAAFVGAASDAPPAVAALLGAQSRVRGSLFATLNDATCVGATVVHIPPHVVVDAPLHVFYASSGAADSVTVSAPRLLIVVEEGGSAEVVEEYVALGAAAGGYLVNGVTEVALGVRGALKHSYLALDGAAAFHVKATLVAQAEESMYSLVEARLGGRLTR